MFNQLRTLAAGHDDGGRNICAVGARDGVTALVVAAAGERRVDFAQHLGAAIVVAADDDAVGEKKICDRGTLAQEFRIRCHVKSIRIGAIAQDDLAHPLAGVDRNRALLDHNLVVVDGAGNFSGDRFHKRQVSFAAIRRGRAHGDENGGARAHRFMQIVGELQTAAAMPVQQFRQKFFVDGYLPSLESG